MKTKIFALLMAVVMLLSLTLIGCSDKAADKGDKKDAGKANDQVATQDAKVEIAPEEYVERLFDNSIADFKGTLEESLKNTRTTLSIGDLTQILTLADVDTTEMPPLSDITLDLYSSTTDYDVAYASAMLDKTLCDTSLFITNNGDFIISSNLVEGAYSITLEELLALIGEGGALPYNFSEISKYDNEFTINLYVKYAELFYNAILKHADITATDNGDTVSATLRISPEGIAAIIAEFAETIKNDTELIEYINLLLTSEGLDPISADDIVVDTDEIIKELEAVDFYIEVNMTIDKYTVFAKKTDIIFNLDGEQLTIAITSEDENNFDAVVSVGEYSMFELKLEVKSTDDSCFIKLAIIEDGTDLSSIVLDAKDGVAEFSVTTATGEFVAITGKYEISDKMFKYMLESITYMDETLDLTPSKIALAVETDVTLPALPQNTKELLTLTESELSTLAMQLVFNSGILNYVNIY